MPYGREHAAARSRLGAAEVDGRIYTVGGSTSSGVPLATVEVYDPATCRWTARAAMPPPRMELAVVARWFATNAGVRRFDGSNWTVYDLGPADDAVYAVAMDGTGSAWFTTDNEMGTSLSYHARATGEEMASRW